MGQQMIFWYCIASESSEGSGKSAVCRLARAFAARIHKDLNPRWMRQCWRLLFPFFDTDDTIVWPEQTHYHSSKDKNS